MGEDTGPVYVRENGKMFIVGSHLSNTRTHSASLFSRAFSVELCLKHEDATKHKEKSFFFTYTEQGSLRYSAKPLFNLTLDLIADNIQHVESLLGFPDQVAEKLFVAADIRQKFHVPGSGLKALQTFTEAYGDLILSSLCLRGRYLLVSEKLEEIKCFQGLCSLDLSCCKLGDEHELIEHLSSKTLNSLEKLYLKDNCLSDAGIRRMTAPTRVLHRGLGNLTLLDLSDNQGITDSGVKFLFTFKTLNFLDVSGTSIKGATVEKIERSTGLKCSKEPLPPFNHIGCKTEGWAEQLFDQWEKYIFSTIKSTKKGKPKAETMAQKFYGKAKTQQLKEEETLSLPEAPLQIHKHLQFYRPENQKEIVICDCSRIKSSKRALEKGPQDATPAPVSKRPSLLFSVDDLKLLDSY